MASTCLVSAKDFKTYFEGVTCPECRYHSRTPEEFTFFYCPSEPDKCEGCEIDETRRECPICLHIWDVYVATEAQP